jgi:hypothetical protein
MSLRAGLDKRLDEKFFVSARDRTSVAQSVVRNYTDRASPGPKWLIQVSV